MEEGTSRQGSRTNNAAQSKTKARVISASDDDEEHDTEVPNDDPLPPKGQQSKRKNVSTPNQKVKSTPVSPPYSIAGFTFTNGSGNMTIVNVGNLHNSATSDSFNDNSKLEMEAGVNDPQHASVPPPTDDIYHGQHE